MRVILLTHYYPPEPGAPQRRWGALAHELAGRGVEVTVHTGFPHYPDGRIPAPYSNRPWTIERDHGVKVVRSAVAALPNRGFAPRLLDHTVFAFSSLVTAPLAGRADVVVVESPPLFLAASAVAYARAKRARLVLNVSDLWPESAVELGALTRPRLIDAAERMARFAYGNADAITVPTEGIAAALERIPEAAGKVHWLPPAVDADSFRTDPPRRAGPLRVLYAGTVALAQGLDTLVEAARIAGPDVVEVTITGGGVEVGDLGARINEGSILNVKLFGPVAADAVPGLYARADVGAVLLRDRPVFRGALPTKLLESMAAGRPVVLSAAGESARFVDRYGSGVVVAPEEPAALAEALIDLRDMSDQAFGGLSAAARSCARAHDRPQSVERWLSVLAPGVASLRPSTTTAGRPT